MFTRVVSQAVLGGLVLFGWQTVAHLPMPWTADTVMRFSEEASVQAVVLDEAPTSGTYFLPYEEDEANVDDPAIFVAVQREGPRPFVVSMSGQIFANILALAIAAVFLRPFRVMRFVQRMGLVVAIGFVGWLVGSLPHFLWWGFSAAFVGGELLNTVIGWALAGFVLTAGMPRGGETMVPNGGA